VVQQPEQESAVEDKHLQQIGLNNLRNSLFERLYKLACRENWDWAYAQLSHQGRMHQEIMDFPNLHFYQDRLAILPSEIPHHQQQIAPLELNLPDEGEPLFDVLAKKRLIFLPSRSASETANFKTNIHEAQLITRLVRQFQQLYQFNGKETELNQIGIITPYRAQIAQIRDTLQQAGINPDQLTIDTVERYQGGSRDIILISLCTNSLSQLHSLVSLSDEGVDRKLNVALTRAREHVVIVGNPDLLNQNPTYRSLIEYGKVELPL
jgi:DNA replication ATP-dependent helicase Dna2